MIDFLALAAGLGLSWLCGIALVAALPVIGTDFGKGATRWISLGFVSLQPSEFLKPGFVALVAWFMAASQGRSASSKGRSVRSGTRQLPR